jgi:hypothetical protein
LEYKPRGTEKLDISAESTKKSAKVRRGPMVKKENQLSSYSSFELTNINLAVGQADFHANLPD